MSGQKVGELFAELGLKDDLTKDLGKAERNFKQSAKGMEGKATIGLDDSKLEGGLSKAREQMKAGAEKGMEGMHEATSAAMGPLGETLSGGLAGVGAVAGAALFEGVKEGFDRKAGAAKLGASLGLDPATAQALGAHSAEIYGQAYGDSLGEVNDAVALVTKNIGGLGNITKEQFDEMVKDALNIKSVFGQDVAKTTAAVGQLLRTGLAKDATEAFDIITKGLQGPSNKADDLLDTFNEYSTEFRSLGLDGQTALGMIDQAVVAGARDSDVAGDALKEFNIRVRDGSDTTADGFRRLGLNANDAAKIGIKGMKGWAFTAQDMTNVLAKGGPQARDALQMVLDRIRAVKDPIQQAAIMTDLFGTQSEDMQQALLAFDPSQAVARLGNVEGGAQRVNDQVGDTADSKFESWKRNAQTKLVDVIDTDVIPGLGRLGQAWTDNIGDADDFHAGLDRIGKWWTDNIGTMDDFKHGLSEIGDVAHGLGDALGWVKDHILDPFIGTVQDLTNKVADLLNLGGGPQGFFNMAGNFAAGKGLFNTDTPSFGDGGTVPGPVGAPRIVIAHGGETVLATHKMPVGAAMASAGVGGGGGPAQPIVVPVTLQMGTKTVARATARHDLSTR